MSLEMAELGLSTASSTSATVTPGEIPEDDVETLEPSPKKARLGGPVDLSCLEDRLNGILCCTVCLDLPTVAMFQVIQDCSSNSLPLVIDL